MTLLSCLDTNKNNRLFILSKKIDPPSKVKYPLQQPDNSIFMDFSRDRKNKTKKY